MTIFMKKYVKIFTGIKRTALFSFPPSPPHSLSSHYLLSFIVFYYFLFLSRHFLLLVSSFPFSFSFSFLSSSVFLPSPLLSLFSPLLSLAPPLPSHLLSFPTFSPYLNSFASSPPLMLCSPFLSPPLLCSHPDSHCA